MFYYWFHGLCTIYDPAYLSVYTYLIFRNIHADYNYLFDKMGYTIDRISYEFIRA